MRSRRLGWPRRLARSLGRAAACVRSLHAALGTCLLLLGAPGARAETPPPRGTAHVQYVSAASVYLDAGGASGLVEGTSVRVVRDGRTIAELRVEFAAQSSAACKVVSWTEALRAGDACTFTPAAAADSSGATGGGATPPARPQRAPGAPPRARGEPLWERMTRVDGRVASTYVQTSGNGGTYRNPIFLGDLRWNGEEREQLSLRFRGDRPDFDAVSQTAPISGQPALRVYELQAHYRSPGQTFELEGGRLLASRLELLGYMDGGGTRWQPFSGLTLGAAGGRGAEIAGHEVVRRGDKLGAWIEGTRVRGAQRWRTLAAVGMQRDPDVVRRQFGLLRNDAALGRRLAFYQSLEMDVNPPWSRRLGQPHWMLTAASLTAQVQVQRRTSLSLGFDSRRGLLLPEQRQLPRVVIPERVQAAHAAVYVRLTDAHSMRLGGDVRFLPQGGGTARSWDASFYTSRLGLRALGGGLHAFGYSADRGTNLYFDGSLVARAGRYLRLDLAAGAGRLRTLLDFAGGGERIDHSRWVRAGADLSFGRGVYAGLSSEWRSAGDGREYSVEIGRSF